MTSIEELLNLFLSTDNDTRNKAEEAYEKLSNNDKVAQLLYICQECNKAYEIRKLGAVLLRRLLGNVNDEVYDKLSEELKQLLKSTLLFIMKKEMDESMKKKICDIISETARYSIDDNGDNNWPEILHFMLEAGNLPQLKQNFYQILASFPSIFGSEEKKNLPFIKQTIVSGLADDQTKEMKLSAVKAYSAFIVDNEKDSTILSQFSDVIPTLLKIIADDHLKAINDSQIEDDIFDDEEESFLKNIVEICDSVPKILRPYLTPLLELCTKIISTPNMSDEIKLLALECIVSLAENGAPMFRKFLNHHTNFLQTLIPTILTLMAQLSDDTEAWSKKLSDDIPIEPTESNSQTSNGQPELDDEDFEDNEICTEAETALDRLACALAGKTFLPHVLNCVATMLNSQNWKERHASLMALGAVGEGCHKYMETLLGTIVDGIIIYLNDAHPRVRYAACNAIGQMASDFAPLFEKKFHAKIIPGLTKVLEDVQNPKVQSHSAAALVNFCEECPQNIIIQYLQLLLDKCEIVFTQNTKDLFDNPAINQQSINKNVIQFANAKKKILEQITTAIASIADAAKLSFIPFYSKFVPCLKFIIQHTTDSIQQTPNEMSGKRHSMTFSLLRGKAIECLTLIGMAVGRETFLPDSHDIMKLLLPLQTGQLKIADDDPQLSYLISAWARMCSIMGPEFVQYLPIVMGPVIQTASYKPEVAFVDSETAKEVNTNDWQFVNIGEGGQNFGLKTTGLDDKATACQMLVCYARELKHNFSPIYVQQTLSIMIPMLKFYFHDGVRTAASESFPYLLECAKGKDAAFVLEVWNSIRPELIKAIDNEPENEVLAEHINSLAQCIDLLGNGCVNSEIPEIMRILEKLFKIHIEKEQERLDKKNDEDYDELVEEDLCMEGDENNYILSKMCDLIHSFYKAYGPIFNPTFVAVILPHALNLLKVGRPWSDHQWGICIIDDFIEFAGPESFQYKDSFLPYLVSFISDDSSEVRQAAVYGIGMMAQNNPQIYRSICLELLPLLRQLITHPDSRAIENIHATENAISAFTKICKFIVSTNPQDMTMLNEMIHEWFGWLPVSEDVEEAQHIYSYFCDLIESNNPIVLGQNNSNIPKIVNIIAEAFNKGVVDVKDLAGIRMRNILRQLQNNIDFFRHCISLLDSPQQNILEKILTQ